ncbi:flagellar basal body P-ring formation chaperone FlgA [soil metagenome]
MRIPVLLALCATFACVFTRPAYAAADVALRPSPSSHGAAITLGDLFDGAGSAASEIVGPAAITGGEAVLDAARLQVAAKRAGLLWENPTGQRRIIVASLGGPAPRASAGAAAPRGRTPAASKRSQTLAYARNVNAGDLLAASAFVWSDEAVAPGDAPSDAEAVIGKAARRPLRAGSAVGLHDLASARVIKRDDLVSVAFEDGGISLVLQAKALADAGVGDTLQLVNIQSKKTVEAVVTGAGKAVVGPAADSLRASVFDPVRLASR